MKTRKKITMLVTVSVPRHMTPAEARREVRSLITDQCNWSAGHDEVKAVRVAPSPAPKLQR